MKKRLLTLLLLSLPGLATAAEQRIDYVELGAKLLKDGYVQRAGNALEKVDVRRDDFPFTRYYTLKGVLLHKQGYPALSNIFFDEAAARGQDNPAIQLYVARNHWQLQEYAGVVEALDRAGEKALENRQMFVIRAEAHKQLGEMEKAWSVLDAGIERFPGYPRFYRQKFYYLVGLGFYRQAVEYAREYLAAGEHDPEDYLAVAYALRENRQLDAAAALLEEAVLRFGHDAKLIELLGQVYIDGERYLSAAQVFDRATLLEPGFAHKAAALYLKAGQPVRALQLNRRIGDQKAKFRQRVGIDIHLDDYQSLVAKTDALERYGLLEENDIVYAVGYAWFRLGDFDRAKAYLKRVTDDRLFQKASHIFKQIDQCNAEPTACI